MSTTPLLKEEIVKQMFFIFNQKKSRLDSYQIKRIRAIQIINKTVQESSSTDIEVSDI